MADSLRSIQTSLVKDIIKQILPHQEIHGALVDLATAHQGPKAKKEDESTTCYIPLQESWINFDGQALQLAPNVFTICIHDHVFRSGTKLTSLSIKKGSLVTLFFDGFNIEVRAKDRLDFPNEGMTIETTPQSSRGEIRKAGPFEDINISFGLVNLAVNTLNFDSDFHWHSGSGSLGVQAFISFDSLVKYKTNDLDVKLLASFLYPQEFYSMDKTHFHSPRKLYVSGTVKFKGKRRSLKRGLVSFDGNGKITSACEDENGVFKCW
jgi:hypothetical protein